MNAASIRRQISGCAFACAFALPTVALRGADAPAGSAPPPLTEERLVELFRPLQTEIAALSPDGKLLAYSLREGDALSLVVVAIDQPEVAKAKITVLTDKDATPMLSATVSEPTPAQITWLAWATPTRLVMETNQNIPVLGGRAADTMWQNATGAIVAVGADGSDARTLVTARDFPVFSNNLPPLPTERTGLRGPDGLTNTDRTPRGATTQSRSEWRVPRVLDFAADDPETLLVVAENPPDFGFYSVNVRTGKLRHLDDHPGDPSMTSLIDREGRIRVGMPNSALHRFPHRFALQTKKFGKPWQSLDEIVTEADRGFSVSPQNYFGRRAAPLAFDYDGKRLYFASNLGRDTFGIYSLDCSTGQRAGLVVENPHLDLWEPAPDVFPDVGYFSFALGDSNRAPIADTSTEIGEGVGEDEEDAPPSAAITAANVIGVAVRPPNSTGLHRPYREGPLVFDRFTRTLVGIRYRSSRPTTSWLRPEWADVQAKLEATLPGRSVEIQQWDESGNRFLVLLRSPADPGSFCVFDRAIGKLAQFAPRLPGRSAKNVPTTLEFGFAGPDGVPITGLVTVPTAPRLKPIPMVVLCPRFPWERAPWDYSAEVEAFSEMGFVVVQFQGRGAWGAGIKRREAIKSGYEEAQLDDIVAVIDHLTKLYHVNPKRVALYGEQHGGFVALRGLQLHPDRFRCAVAVNAPVDLAAWQNELRWNDEAFGPLLTGAYLGDAARMREAPLVRDAAKITRPAMLLHYRGVPGQAALSTFLAAKQLASEVRTPDASTTFVEVERDFMEGRPVAKARAFAQIAEFFNLTIYDYTVEVGPEKVVEP